MIEDALMHFDGVRCRLLAGCIMPNHVHVAIEIVDEHSLTGIVGNWKSLTGKRANSRIGRSGPFRHPDYFDRYTRDEGQLARTVDYLEKIPVKAGLAAEAFNWPWSSARFRKA